MEKQTTFEKMNSLIDVRNDILAKRKEMISDDAGKLFEEKLAPYSKDDINNMTYEQIMELNTVDEETVLLEVPSFKTSDDELEYLRSMFSYIKESDEFINNIDKSLEELNKIIDESNKELQETLNASEDKNVVTLLRLQLSEAIEKETDEDRKKSLIKSQEAFEDSFDLIRIKELYKVIGGSNICREAQTIANDIYSKYVKTNKELGLTYDIVRIADLEEKMLPEEYHKHNNLFIFICMKYISKLTKTRGASRKEDGLFASQLSTNLYMLMTDTLLDQDKERLLKAIQEVLDIVI